MPGRPPRPEKERVISFKVGPKIWGWLDELARHELYGKTPTEVAQYMLRAGIRREQSSEGLLQAPPRKPRGGT
jgi:hypothetical protein